MISLEPFRYTVIDARYVLAGCEFFDLTKEQILQTQRKFFDAVRSFYQGCAFLSWSAGDKNTISEKKLADALFSMGDSTQPFSSLGYEGVVPNSQVNNLREARRYIRMTRYDPRPPVACAKSPNFSQGYDDYYEKYVMDSLATYPDLNELRRGFQTIFDTEGKKYLHYMFTNECQGFIFAYPHKDKPGRFFGNIVLMHSLYSLDTDVSAYCDWVKSFLYDISASFINLNAHIGLSHTITPGYCLSFCNFDGSRGNRYLNDPSRRKIYREDNRERLHYFLAPEWVNILSPFTAEYLGESIRISEGVKVEKLESGALSVCADCGILEFDIPQAKQVKKVLYDALFPGGNFYAPSFDELRDLLNFAPRSYWELTPVFPEEIQIYKSGILVAHNGNKIS